MEDIIYSIMCESFLCCELHAWSGHRPVANVLDFNMCNPGLRIYTGLSLVATNFSKELLPWSRNHI